MSKVHFDSIAVVCEKEVKASKGAKRAGLNALHIGNMIDET